MRIYAFILSTLMLLLIFSLLGDLISFETINKETAEYLMTLLQEESGSQNIVTAVYLQTRVFDTLFETLLLLVSIVGVLHFSKGKGGRDKRW